MWESCHDGDYLYIIWALRKKNVWWNVIILQQIPSCYEEKTDMNIFTFVNHNLTCLPVVDLTEFVMVSIIIFIIVKYSTIENIWTLDHLFQAQTTIFIWISLQNYRFLYFQNSHHCSSLGRNSLSLFLRPSLSTYKY